MVDDVVGFNQGKQVFNVEVPIPVDLVVIKREEYLELLDQAKEGQWWTLDDIISLLGFGRTKVINDILLNPRFKKEMDIEQNPDGFVVYPKGKGSPYMFLASRARKYFEANFATILSQ